MLHRRWAGLCSSGIVGGPGCAAPSGRAVQLRHRRWAGLCIPGIVGGPGCRMYTTATELQEWCRLYNTAEGSAPRVVQVVQHCTVISAISISLSLWNNQLLRSFCDLSQGLVSAVEVFFNQISLRVAVGRIIASIHN